MATPDAAAPLDFLPRLERDVVQTVGETHRGLAAEAAEHVRQYAIIDLDRRVVEDVQQFFHDTFVDTVWPACPRHPNHPLWYRDGWWWCERDGARIAMLGELW